MGTSKVDKGNVDNNTTPTADQQTQLVKKTQSKKVVGTAPFPTKVTPSKPRGESVPVMPDIFGNTKTITKDENDDYGLISPFSSGHRPILLDKALYGDLSHITEGIIKEHREKTAGNEDYNKHRNNLAAHIASIQQKYQDHGFQALSSLGSQHIKENEAIAAIAHMRALGEMLGSIEDKNSPEALRIKHGMDKLWTSMHHWIDKTRQQHGVTLDLKKTLLGSAWCPNLKRKNLKDNEDIKKREVITKPTEANAGDEEETTQGGKKLTPEEESNKVTQNAKLIQGQLNEASNPQLNQAAHELKKYAGGLYEQIKTLNKTPAEARTEDHAERVADLKLRFKRTLDDYHNLESAGLQLNLHTRLTYSRNFKDNVAFQHWYRGDVDLHDINLVHFLNNHPMTNGLRGMFGDIHEHKDGRHELKANSQQLQNLLVYKLLDGPTSVDQTPVTNAQTAMRLFYDGYQNYVRVNGHPPPNTVDAADIIRLSNFDQRNAGKTSVIKTINKGKQFYDEQGNLLKEGKNPDKQGRVWELNDKGELQEAPKSAKWMQKPQSLESFLGFIQENPGMKTEDLIKHYFLKEHDLDSPETHKNIKENSILHTELANITGNPKTYQLFKAAATEVGLAQIGPKLGSYIQALSTGILSKLAHIEPEKFGKLHAYGSVIDRVMMEILASTFNTIHGGVPENKNQRAMWTHCLLQVANDIWGTEEHDKSQAVGWEEQQGEIRALGGVNSSGKLSTGMLQYALSAKHHAKDLSDHYTKEGNHELAAALQDFHENFKPIKGSMVYESPEAIAKKQQQDQQYSEFGGEDTKFNEQALQKFLQGLQPKQASPTARLNKSSSRTLQKVNRKDRYRQLLRFFRTGGRVKFAQFVKAGGGFQAPPASDRTNVPFGNAVAKAATNKNIGHAQLNEQINGKLGVSTKSSTGVFSSPGGSEQSTIHHIQEQIDANKLRYLGAWHGLSGQKKSVLVFHPNEKGTDSLYHVYHPETDVGKVKSHLETSGFPFHTIIPGAKGTKVLVFDPQQQNRNAMETFATKNNLKVEENTGQGEILGHNGDWNSAGALPKSRQAFRNIINEYEQNNQSAGTTNSSGGSPTGTAKTGTGKTPFSKSGPRARFNKSKTRRILEGLLRNHNSPNKELPAACDLLAPDLDNLKEQHLDKYQSLVPGVKWPEIQLAVHDVQSDPEKFNDMTGESNRRDMYCKEHARSVLQSSGLAKMIDSLVVNQAIPEHAQHLIEDAKDGDYFALEALSAELQHSVPALKSLAKSAEREFNKAGKTWDKTRSGVRKFQKGAKWLGRVESKRGVVDRGEFRGCGQFRPKTPGEKHLENMHLHFNKGNNNITNAINYFRSR